MNNLLKLGKKIFTVGVASTTIFWSLGVAALVPAVATAASTVDCATVVAGDFVKANGADIWVVNADKTKSYFPHGDTFKSWTADNKYTFKSVSGDCLASFSAAGIVAPRPGAYLLKDNATDKLYAVLTGGKMAEISADAAKGLFGSNYAALPAKGGRVVPATSPDMVLYSKSIDAASKVTEAAPTLGSLVSNAGKYYVVGANKSLQEVTETGLTANKMQAKFATALASTSGYTMGAAVSAADASLNDPTFGFKAAPGTVTPPVVSSGPVTVSLASDTPAAKGVPQDATGVEFLKFNVSGSGTLNDLVLKRTDLGGYDDFSAVYIYDGSTRLTSGRTVASDTNKVIFSNLKIALSSTPKALRVVADLADNTSGTTGAASGERDGFDVVEANGSAVTGVVGSVMSISAVSVSTVTIDNSGSTGSFRLGASAVEVGRGTINAGSATNDVVVNSLTLTNAGSLSNSYLTNLKLTLGSTDAVTGASMSGDKVTFVLAKPYTITKGDTKTFIVYTDNTGGRTDDTVKFYVDETSDVNVTDSQYGVGVKLTNSFASGDQTYTVTGGDLTLSNNGPAAGNIGKNVTNVVVQKFSFSATNNVTVKSTKLWVFLQNSSGTAVTTTADLNYIKNVKIVDLDNNNQTVIGPQAAWGTGTTVQGSGSDIDGVYKVFTDAYDIAAGKTKHFAVMVDIDTNMTAGYKLYSKVDYSGTNYVKYVDNSQYVSAANIVPSTLSGNIMTVSGAQLTVSRTTPPASATVVKGSTQNALGMLLTAGTSDDLKITSLKLRVFASSSAITGDAGGVAGNTVVNTVSLWEDGATAPLATKNLSDNTGTVSDSGDTDYYYVTYTGLNYKVPAGSSKKLIAQLGIKDNLTATRYVSVDIVPATGATTNADIEVETWADGKTVTQNTTSAINSSSPIYLTITTGGSMTVAVDGNTPVAGDVLTGSASAVPMTVFKLTPSQESFTLVGAALVASSTNGGSAYADISKLVVTYKNKAGVTVNKECFLNSSDQCTFNDGQLDAYLMKDQANLITISAYFNKINDGSTSGHQVKVSFLKATAANQFGASANLTNGFILLGEGSNAKKYGVTDSITLVDSGVNAKTLHKTLVTAAESDSSGVAHTTKAQDAVGVFTFTSEGEAGSSQNSTLNSVTVQLSGNLIASSAGNGTVTVNVYNGNSFDSSHLMGSGTLTGVDTGSSTALSITLSSYNEWTGTKQVYVVVDTTDADFSDTSSNTEKLTATLSGFGWSDGSANISAAFGLPVYGDTYSY